MKLGLRNKLMISFFLLITVPMVLLGSLSYYKSSTALQSSIEHELITTTNESAALINNQLDSIKSYVSIESKNETLIKIAETKSNNGDLKKSGYSIIKDFIATNDKIIETVAVVDSNGHGIVSSDGTDITLDISDREYFKTAISGIDAVSDVLLSKATNNPVVIVASPLRFGNSVVGVLIASVKFSALTEHVEKIKVGTSGYAYMINKDGLIINHPVKEKILTEDASKTDNADLKSYIQSMEKGESGTGFYTYEGVKKFVAYAPVGKWAIAVTAPYKEYMEPAINIRNLTIIFVMLFIGIAVIVSGIFSYKVIINPIKKLQDLMVSAGEGDLSVRSNINTGDEIEILGKSFNGMLKEQEQIVKRVRSGAAELVSSSEEMAASSEEITAGSEEMAANIQEVAYGSENQNNSIFEASQVLSQLSNLVQEAQEKVTSASSNAENTKKAANKGRRRVEDTVQAMKIISTSTNETAEILKAVNELSVKVGQIVGTINSIAEQTNLLALNAAIEAARAGEHGRGFTVVADEVRKLSEESNSGAREIGALINEMIAKIENAVSSMDSAIGAVDNGVKVANDTDKSLMVIINDVNNISEDIEGIANLTDNQVLTSVEIVKSLDKIKNISEGNYVNSHSVSAASQEQASAIESLSATAEEVSALALELESLVTRFKITDDM